MSDDMKIGPNRESAKRLGLKYDGDQEFILLMEQKLAAVTAERDEAKLDVKDWSDRAYAAEHNLIAATERAEKVEAYADYEKKRADRKRCPCEFGSPCHKRCTCANPGSSFGCRRCCSYGSPEQQAGMAKVLIENEQRAEKAEARAVAHWAECEAWRAAHAKWCEGDYHFREPTEAREASDRARGEANPTKEPPEETKEACVLPNSCTLYVKPNGAGGRTYFSDEVGGGVFVWDTCLVAESTLLAAMAHEAKLYCAEQHAARAKTSEANPTYTPPTEGGENPQ